MNASVDSTTSHTSLEAEYVSEEGFGESLTITCAAAEPSLNPRTAAED